ncbi:MAG: hypothetical protein AMXMBFR81_14110 [Chthonomonas sp.]
MRGISDLLAPTPTILPQTPTSRPCRAQPRIPHRTAKEVKEPPVSLKREQARDLLRAAAMSDVPESWHFLFLTGTRLAEASGLRWKDLDLAAGTARIAGQLLRQNGEL